MTYEYQCSCCSETFEVQQKITDKKGAECPRCLTWTDNRLISGGTSFTLVGDGWASDNYSKRPG